MTTPTPPRSTRLSCQVYLSADFPVVFGANLGDPAQCGDMAAPGDIYALKRSARAYRLDYAAVGPGNAQTVATGSDLGQEGAAIAPLGRMMLMSEDGAMLEILLLRVGTQDLLRPLSPVQQGREYTLLSADGAAGDLELAEMTCVSFTRGTRIALSSGAQSAVEALKPGDRVLTRDNGPQPVRWIGQQTTRAIGAYAPVVICEGALNNAADLVLSPDHRLFIYQRHDAIGVGQAEVLVRARHLVNDDTIYQREGGFVDYFHLLFDAHEIIYAEGIPAESLMVTTHTLAALPEDMADEVKDRFPGGATQQHRGVEPDPQKLEGRNTAEMLRRASMG